MSPEVHVGAPNSSNEDFLGFPGHTAYHVATGCGLGAAFKLTWQMVILLLCH